MRVVIAGAGSVGRSIASDLLDNQHEVLLIDRNPAAMKVSSVAEADWLLADACELSALREAHLESADVVVAATSDDKANLVLALLAKTEFGVPRVVARVNNPKNEWMFDESWGVDVAVSTPRTMTALVEEAVAIGDLVRVFTFRGAQTNMVELTLPDSSPVVGQLVGEITWPAEAALVGIIRDGRPIAPEADDTLEARDQVLILAAESSEKELKRLLLAGEAAANSATHTVPSTATP